MRFGYASKGKAPFALILGVAALALLAAGGCARVTTAAPTLSASATARPAAAPTAPAAQSTAAESRMSLVARAEREARDALLDKVGAMDSGRGMPLSELAVIDPFVGAALKDTVRDSKVSERTTDKDGAVTVTVRMELSPIQDLLAHYPNHAMK
ncbi:MAG: hypothetical protein M1457_02280 [bacterium]|nr:hypothetical protein [bacterium]